MHTVKRTFMKNTILLFSMLPLIVLAQGQSPIVYGGKDNLMKALVTKQVTSVPITMHLSKTEEKLGFSFYVNDEHAIYVENIKDGQTIDVPVKMNKENVPETHVICSVNHIDDDAVGTLFRLKVCTRAELIWVGD